MIKNILELLKVVDETFKEGFKQIKREIKWQKK